MLEDLYIISYPALWALLPPTIAALLAVLPVTRRRLSEFAERHRVEVTVGNGRGLIRYLARVRRYRSLGGAAGWLLGFVLSALAADPALLLEGRASDPVGTAALTGIAGYLIGALVAELRTAGAPPPGKRLASLTPRRVADYVTPGARLAPLLLTAATVGAFVCRSLWPAPRVAWQAAAGVALCSVLVAVVVALAQRWIAGRPQRAAAADLRAADEAVRASSMQTISGAGAALMSIAVALLLSGVDRAAAPAPAAQVLGFGLVAFQVLALLSWLGLRHWSLPVRRTASA